MMVVCDDVCPVHNINTAVFIHNNNHNNEMEWWKSEHVCNAMLCGVGGGGDRCALSWLESIVKWFRFNMRNDTQNIATGIGYRAHMWYNIVHTHRYMRRNQKPVWDLIWLFVFFVVVVGVSVWWCWCCAIRSISDKVSEVRLIGPHNTITIINNRVYETNMSHHACYSPHKSNIII